MKINEKDIKISNIGKEASKAGVAFGAFLMAKTASKFIGEATDKAVSGLGANPNTPLIKAVKPIGITILGAGMSYAMKDKYAKAAGVGIAFAGIEEGYNLAMGMKNDLFPREEIAGFGSNLIATPTLNLPELSGDDGYSDVALDQYNEDEDDDFLEGAEDYEEYEDYIEL